MKYFTVSDSFIPAIKLNKFKLTSSVFCFIQNIYIN